MISTVPRLAVITMVVVAVAALAGCGVRTQAEPDAIDRDDVPFDLLLPKARTDPNGSPPGVNTYVLYFVEQDRVVATTRSQSERPQTREVLRRLVQGVTPEEAARGLRSAIPQGSTVRRVSIHGHVATIDLGGAFDLVSDQARILAFAQLVFTATETLAFTHVRFELDARRIDVPTMDGRLTSEPVSRDDYALTATAITSNPAS